MAGIETGSVDCIFTDPPYGYLKGQKLDRPFAEGGFFDQSKRVLRKDGFIVLFGRGSSFYRWNTHLADRGFAFKEEIIWNKGYNSSPLLPISRVHETVSIHTRGRGIINKIKIPYLEMKGHDLGAIVTDIKRLKAQLKNAKSLAAIEAFLEGKAVEYEPMTCKNSVQIEDHIRDFNRGVKRMRALENGMLEKTIIHNSERKHKNSTTVQPSKLVNMDRGAATVSAFEGGMTEKDVIKESRDHFRAVHPTQKPTRLIERILALVTKPGDLVLDPFAGSFSTGIACLNLRLRFIGIEIDADYFTAGTERLTNQRQFPLI